MKWFNKLIEHRRLIGLLLLGWLFLLTTDISKSISMINKAGKDLELGFVMIRALSVWGWIAVFTPLIWKLADRFPIHKDTWLFTIPLHIVISLLFMGVHAGLHRLTMEVYYQEGLTLFTWADHTLNIMVWLGLVSCFSYWLMGGIRHLLTYYGRYRERALRNARLEAELTQTRLQVLSMQLHPHFLFNTLHNVNTLIYEDVDTAESILKKLKTLFEQSFSHSEVQEVTLADEIEFISHYLDIEKTRFSDRLHVDWHLDPAAMDAYVPRFLLQPIVENAVRHGIAKKIEPATIRIIARKMKDRLQIIVEDEGPGLEKLPAHIGQNQSRNGQGMGLSNTRNRLMNLYEDYRFELASSSLGGVKVLIELPYGTEKYKQWKEEVGVWNG